MAVLSPRRLSLTRDRPSVSIDEASKLQEQAYRKAEGAKPAEVYGFVGAISTIVAFAIYILWAYCPEIWLHNIGITYYPDRYWAIALPAFVMVTVVFGLSAYIALNHLVTPPVDSLTTLFDDNSRQALSFSFADEQPIDPIADLPLPLLNEVMLS